MDDKFIVFEQRLIDGVVVSILADASSLAFVKNGVPAKGQVEYRMRKATAEERASLAGADGVLPRGTPV